MGKPSVSNRDIEGIISLRQHGYTISEIKMSSGFGRGTISKYIQGIKILPEFLKHWKEKKMSSAVRCEQEKQKALLEARNFIRNITIKDKLLIATCLYWAEGAKKDFSLSNTDPLLIKTFIQCLKELGIGKERLKVSIRIYEDLDKEKACVFWSNTIGIPKESIKSINVLKGKKKGKLEYGMCRVRVIKGGYYLKLIKSIKDIIKDKI